MVVFAPQNVIMDPPFTKIDILSCRNLLIYLFLAAEKAPGPLSLQLKSRRVSCFWVVRKPPAA
jgi:hypothetical protein